MSSDSQGGFTVASHIESISNPENAPENNNGNQPYVFVSIEDPVYDGEEGWFARVVVDPTTGDYKESYSAETREDAIEEATTLAEKHDLPVLTSVFDMTLDI